MDIKLSPGPRIRAVTPNTGLLGWEAIDRPYAAQELASSGLFLSDLGREPSRLGSALKAHKPAAPVEKKAEDTVQGVVAAERTLQSASNARGAVTAATRVLLNGEAVEDVVAGGAHNSSTSGKVVASLGVLGGLAQTGHGVSQLANGKTSEGVVNVSAGGLTTAAGTMELAAPAIIAKRFVPVLAGGAGVVEGVSDVVRGVQKDDNEKVVVGSLKTTGGAMLAAAPFVGGTVVGAPAAVVLGVAGGVVLGGAEIYEAVQHFRGE